MLLRSFGRNPSSGSNHSQPPRSVAPLQGGAGTHYWLQSGGGIELAQGGLSMWACVNLLVGCKCIIFHNQPAVWCTRENEAAVALQMERRLAGENVFAGVFFFLGNRQRLKDREWKIREKEERLWLHLCVSVRVIMPHNFWISRKCFQWWTTIQIFWHWGNFTSFCQLQPRLSF